MTYHPYPKVLYRDGVICDDYVIVPDSERQTEKAADGYFALGEKPAKDRKILRVKNGKGN